MQTLLICPRKLFDRSCYLWAQGKSLAFDAPHHWSQFYSCVVHYTYISPLHSVKRLLCQTDYANHMKCWRTAEMVCRFLGNGAQKWSVVILRPRIESCLCNYVYAFMFMHLADHYWKYSIEKSVWVYSSKCHTYWKLNYCDMEKLWPFKPLVVRSSWVG